MGVCLSDLNMQAQKWATPNVPNRRPELKANKRPESGGEDTQTQAMNWPTPISRDAIYAAMSEEAIAKVSQDRDDSLTRATYNFSRQDEMTTDDGLSLLLAVWTPPVCPRLSADFQHWLMGWPAPIRTCFDSAEMASYRLRLRSLLRFCWEVLSNEP